MDLSSIILDAVWRPAFVFRYESLKSQAGRVSSQSSASSSWESSEVNPKNRIDSLNISNSRWRIDGATISGTQFFCVPTYLMTGLVPLRVDVFVPDQNDHPLNLREVLASSASVALRHPQAIGDLGISHHLCRALDYRCEYDPEFLDNYLRLPFGSKLVFESVTADVSEMALTIIPAHDLEKQSLSVLSLRKLWEGEVPECEWPETMDIARLHLMRQLHDSVSVVRIADWNHPQDLIFKSSTNNFKHLYHELKFLLMVSAHSNVMRRPLNIITKKCCFGGKHGVVGFTLPYYQLGSIRDELALRTLSGVLSFKHQIKWSRQVTSALIHIKEDAGTFYSDLRPDNVLLVASPTEDEEDIVLCDFEQRGNWHEWCAPEVLYRQYVHNIYSHPSSLARGNRWRPLVDAYFPTHRSCKQEAFVDPAIKSKNPAWFLLSPSAAEKAMVYSLGLFFYCVFEGLSNVRVSIANAYPIDPDVEFPEFRRTPPAVREIIRTCTIDAPEWRDQLDKGIWQSGGKGPTRRVVRRGHKLYPEGVTDADLNGQSGREVAGLVLDTAMDWWTRELERAQEFLKSEEWKTGDFGNKRPTLREVLGMLQRIEEGVQYP